MKVLTLDIERVPAIGTVWELFNQNVSLDSLLKDADTCCFAAKWHGQDGTITMNYLDHTQKQMAKKLWELLSEADRVVTYNGGRFDLKVLNTMFLEHNLPPPRPYKNVDLYRVVRSRFYGTSNKLDYWLRKLNIGSKMATGGAKLWTSTLVGDRDAMAQMLEYNIEDVRLTEILYDKLLPWAPSLGPSVTEDGTTLCKCGCDTFVAEGVHTASRLSYIRYVCTNCGEWLRSTTAIKGVPKPALVRVPQV